MAASKQQFIQLLKSNDLKKLFVQLLGWDNDRLTFTEKLNEEVFACECIVEKSGFKIVVVKPKTGNGIPVYAIRKRLGNAITKRFRENLIIFTGTTSEKQVWHYTIRKAGKPALTSEIPYHTGQSPELLFQKLQGIFFDLDEQDNITIIDVSKRVEDSFEKNAKQVVKKFYREFQQQHRSFLKFIKGIKEEVNQEWYASLMLNRLMFCYFIQKKGFLNGDIHYLKNKLTECDEKFGKDRFYSFYRTFLLTLFHKGLGGPADERTKKEKDLLGNIPYLNGGLFDEHIIEKENDSIEIKDEAFKAVFGFFDEWNWYLDTREHATGNNINPDVIGYIFEQYINDRAQMGAYYTREDITDYISKNCLFPWLVEETARNYAAPFDKDGEFFNLIKHSGDTYIYPAVKHGITWDVHSNMPVEKPAGVPKHILDGADTARPNLLERRNYWNDAAPAEAALPTEIWREVMERRNRYDELLQTIKKGGITHINDCITHNLNITQIVLDWLGNTADPRAIKHFYEALTKVSVLDPTCGSGAFLFAALNLLEPLYETCLMRMHSFVEEEDRQNAADRKSFKNAHDFFRNTLAAVKQDIHPSQEYFIYKTIILRNLYGVDIMNEAVEIAKLRLFLKLVAAVQLDTRKANFGLEPLPDIDFNIRCGNTLIGFATMGQMREGLRYDIEGAAHLPQIEEQCTLIAQAFEHFKTIQLNHGDDHKSFVAAKRQLQKRLDKLNEGLNTFLAKTYGILDKEKVITIEVKEGKETKNLPAGRQGKRVNQYEHWLSTHQPFHWLAEYYEIIVKRGGFDVIIGNPPYVEYSKAKKTYLVKDYQTETCGNLYVFVLERCNPILNGNGFCGMIIPLSICSGERMELLREFTSNRYKNLHLSNFEIFPSKLFEGAFQRLTIILGKNRAKDSKNKPRLISRLHRWYSAERELLIDRINYTSISNKERLKLFGKYQSPSHLEVISRISSETSIVANHCKKQNSDSFIYYQEATNYWMKASMRVPYYKKNGKIAEPAHGRFIHLDKETYACSVLSLLNSSLFYVWYITYSDGFHLSDMLVKSFPVADELLKNSELIRFGMLLEKDIKRNASLTTRNTQNDDIEIEVFKISLSKPIIDEIDKVLAQYYGFTEEELDFIINYDIKYRMGLGRSGGEDEEE